MKAVVVEKYDSIDNVTLKDVAMPEAGSGQLRIKVQAASIGFVDGLKVRAATRPRIRCPSSPALNLPALSMP